MIVENLFTKKKSNNIIKKNYNPLNESEGLCMKKENETLKEVKNELNWLEKIIVRIFNKTFNKVADLIRINTVNNMIK